MSALRSRIERLRPWTVLTKVKNGVEMLSVAQPPHQETPARARRSLQRFHSAFAGEPQVFRVKHRLAKRKVPTIEAGTSSIEKEWKADEELDFRRREEG